MVQELHVERARGRGLVGNIYLGRVARVLPGMQSAFVEIGLERAAFLHVADIWEHRQNGHGEPTRPIERILHEGQTLLVQVVKDPIGTKGARLSTQISLAGRLLVYLPQDPHIGISQRIEDESRARAAARAGCSSCCPPDETGGFIMRTMAEAATDARAADRHRLPAQALGATHASARATCRAPTLLYQDLTLAQRVLRDLATEETARILVDSRETFVKMLDVRARVHAGARRAHRALRRRAAALRPATASRTRSRRRCARRVDLKSGGYLIIDQTEAMTTIDVNTGGFVGGRNFDDTIFKTNLEAAQAIARQLRLRNLGGIIIIDFIDMENDEHRDAVLAELKQGARARPHAHHGQRLHAARPGRDDAQAHARVARARAVRALPDLRAAAARSRRAQTVCYEILREILREARQFNAREFRILASQSVIDLFLDEESQRLAHARRLHRQADLAAGRDRATRRSSTTSS